MEMIHLQAISLPITLIEKFGIYWTEDFHMHRKKEAIAMMH
jgi:hypothetical protein